MNDYRKSSHPIFSLQVHISWITKYRYKVLHKEVGYRTKELIRRICLEENVEIISGSVAPDHVHILVSIDPSTSISTLVKYLKGKTSRKLQMEFPNLKKTLLKSTSLNTKIFCGICWECKRGND